MPRFLDTYEVVILDMNGTFMFGHDRLSPKEDFGSTYRHLGGENLGPIEIQTYVNKVVKELSTIYQDTERQDSFPRVDQVAAYLFPRLPFSEVTFIADVIASHELGTVTPDSVLLLRQLALEKQVGLMTNIWSQKDVWLKYFVQIDLKALWTFCAFSSDGSSIKPSMQFFLTTIKAFDVSPNRILFIGDSLERDIRPARELGLGTILVGDCSNKIADRSVTGLHEILTLP